MGSSCASRSRLAPTPCLQAPRGRSLLGWPPALSLSRYAGFMTDRDGWPHLLDFAASRLEHQYHGSVEPKKGVEIVDYHVPALLHAIAKACQNTELLCGYVAWT